MLDWTASDVLGETLERLFPPGEGASALRQEMTDALTVGRGGGTEGWRICRDGSQIWAVGEMSPIRDRAGAVVGFTKILHDRTKSREAQEAIRSEEHTSALQSLMRNSYAVLCLKKKTTRRLAQRRAWLSTPLARHTQNSRGN